MRTLPIGLMSIAEFMPRKNAVLLGGPESVRAMKAMGKAVTRQILLRGLRKGGTPVRRDMRRNAPRRTGKLHRSIVMRTLREALPTIGIGPTRDVWYAHFSEFGTSSEPAQGWARRAWDENHRAIPKRFAESVHKDIIKQAKKLEGGLRRSGLLSRRGVVRRFGL